MTILFWPTHNRDARSAAGGKIAPIRSNQSCCAATTNAFSKNPSNELLRITQPVSRFHQKYGKGVLKLLRYPLPKISVLTEHGRSIVYFGYLLHWALSGLLIFVGMVELPSVGRLRKNVVIEIPERQCPFQVVHPQSARSFACGWSRTSTIAGWDRYSSEDEIWQNEDTGVCYGVLPRYNLASRHEQDDPAISTFACQHIGRANCTFINSLAFLEHEYATTPADKAFLGIVTDEPSRWSPWRLPGILLALWLLAMTSFLMVTKRLLQGSRASLK